MQKLEPYYILEETDNVYKIAELITNSNDQYVYMLFDQHFGDLHTYMKYKKRLDESEARLIFRQCVEIVDECHQNGIILKDIKLKKFVFLDEQKYIYKKYNYYYTREPKKNDF